MAEDEVNEGSPDQARRMKRRDFLRAALAASASVLVDARSPAEPATPQKSKAPAAPGTKTSSAAPSGELKVGIDTYGGAESWDAVTNNVVVNDTTVIQVFDTLFTMKDGTLRPNVVEKWEMAADGLSWTYHIRRGIKFHNGDDLTATDVKYSLDRFISKEAYFSDMRGVVDHIDQVDNYTVRLFTKRPVPFLPELSAESQPAQGFVLPKAYIEKNGMPYFQQHPIGSGPLKFSRKATNNFIEYAAVDKHWRKTPAFKKITLLLVRDEATRVAMLKTGEIDVTPVSIDTAVDLEKQGFTVYPVFAEQPFVMINGSYDPRASGMPVANIKVRQAISLAIDREAIAKELFHGKTGRLMPPYLLPGQTDIDTPYWQEQCKRYYRYDPNEAKKLLAEAGYANGFSIKLFSFPASGSPYLPRLLEATAAYWAKVGIRGEITPLDYAQYLKIRTEPAQELVGNINLMRGGSAAPVPKELQVVYGNDSPYRITGMAGKKTGTPELDALIKQLYAEVDAAKRKDLIAKAIKMGMDTWTVIPYYSVQSMIAVSSKVQFEIPPATVAGYLGLYVADALHK